MGDSIPCYGSFLVDFFQVFICSKWDSSNVGLKSDPQVVVNLCVCVCVTVHGFVECVQIMRW